MKLQSQVCSLELAQKLKTLGVKQESLFVWTTKGQLWRDIDLIEEYTKDVGEVSCAAFTVAELGEHIKKIGLRALQTQADVAVRGSYLFDTDYWATVLIYLLENKLITL